MTPPLPHANCYWVVPGRLMAGEYPSGWDEPSTRERLRRYLECGVSCFVDLTEPGELEPYEALLREEAGQRARAVRYERLPVRDFQVPSREGMALILDRIDQALAAGEVVYVHCWGGVGRTGTVVGCYLVRAGLSGEAALERLGEWWNGVAKRTRHPRTPETAEQVAMILHWAG